LSAATVQTFSIRTKVLVFVASVVVIPGVIYGTLAVANSRRALARASGLQLASEAQSTADRLATELRATRDALASAAHQDVMREIRVGDLDKRISSFLTSLQRGCPPCLDLMVVDGGDRIVAASDPASIGRTSEQPLGAPADGVAIAGPLDAASDRPVLRMTAAIPDPDASSQGLGPSTKVLGRVIALLDWNRVTEAAAQTRANLGRAGIDADVLVVDEHAVVVGGAPREGSRWDRGDRVRPNAWHRAESDAAARVDEDAGVLIGRARLPDDLPPWTILVAQASSEAFASVRRLAGLLGAILVGTLLVALAVALAAARRATRPLAELADAAREVGRGGLVPTIAVRSSDEIGALAAAFNRMAADLRHAERRLVDAAKFAFVGELAAGVAHEVRTPLGVLRTSAQLLERSLRPEDEESRELLRMLRDEVDRIEGVVSGLLELGRPRELRLEHAHLGQVVGRAADFVAVQARDKGLRIVRRPVDPDPQVVCDPELVYQVALNLLVNAIQALPAGGTIVLAVCPPAGGFAGFEVRDDGPGIPTDLRATLFQPFATRRSGGIGLGLTFVQRVVLEHHGRLSVADASPHGTVFRVELPLPEDA
jgi:signal transduction histidine kinase/Tfp pilus assembly protein PilN